MLHSFYMKAQKFSTTFNVICIQMGVLVAISIPIFTSQLEKSRDAVTLSNLRAAYAQAQTAYLTESSDGTDVVYTAKTASAAATVVVKNVESKGEKEGLDNLDQMEWIPTAAQTTLKSATSLGGKAQKWDVTFTYDADGKITNVTAAAHSTT